MNTASSFTSLGWGDLSASASGFLPYDFADEGVVPAQRTKHDSFTHSESNLTVTLPWSQPKQHSELSLENHSGAGSWIQPVQSLSDSNIESPRAAPLKTDPGETITAGTTQEVLNFVSQYDDPEVRAQLTTSLMIVVALAGSAGLLVYLRSLRRRMPPPFPTEVDERPTDFGRITKAQQNYNLAQTVEIIGRVFGDFFKGWGVYQTNWAKMAGRDANSELAQFVRDLLYTSTLVDHLPDWLNFTKLIPEIFRRSDLDTAGREGLTFQGAATGQINNFKVASYWIKNKILRRSKIEADRKKDSDPYHFANTLKKIRGESLLNWAWGGEKLCNIGFFLSSLAAVTTGNSELFYAGATCLFAGRVLDITGFVGSMYATPAIVRDNEHGHAKEQHTRDTKYPCWDAEKLVEATVGCESEVGATFLAEQKVRRQETQGRLQTLQIERSKIHAQLQWIPGLPHPVNNSLLNEEKIARLVAKDADFELQMTKILHAYYRVSAERIWNCLLADQDLSKLAQWLGQQEKELIVTIKSLAQNEFRLNKVNSERLKLARHGLIGVRATAGLLDCIYDKYLAEQPITTDDLVTNWIERAEETAGRFDSGTTQFAINRFFDGLGKIPLSAWAIGYGAWELLGGESGAEVAATLNGSAPINDYWFYGLAATQVIGPILGYVLNTKNRNIAKAEGDTSNAFYYRMGRWSQAFIIASMITFVLPETKPFGIGLFGAIGNLLTLAQQRYHTRKQYALTRVFFRLLGADQTINIEEPQIGIRYLRPRAVLG